MRLIRIRVPGEDFAAAAPIIPPMSPEFYRIAHIVGVLMLFLGLGGMLACGGREGAKAPALFPMLHGLGLIVMVVAGIGRAHKVGFGWPSWLLLKIVCWLVIAVLPVFVKRGKLAFSNQCGNKVAQPGDFAITRSLAWTMVSKPDPHRRCTRMAGTSWGTPAYSPMWRGR